MFDDAVSLKEQLEQKAKAARQNGTPSSEVSVAASAGPEAEDEENSTRAFAAKRGQKDRSEDVEFRLLDPDAPDVAVEYSFRRRTIWHKAEGKIEMQFVDGLKILIEGTGLFDLKEKLRMRRVTWVQEQGGDAIARTDAAHAAGEQREPFVWVERITIEEPEIEQNDR